jgi:lipid A 3-O-deacylase
MFPIRERTLQLIFLCSSLILGGILDGTAAAQQPPSNATNPHDTRENALVNGRGAWELGAFLGGGTGAGKSSDTQFLYAGGRGGLVLTPDLFTSTPIRGNLEYAVEVMPVYTVFTPNGAVYGASIKPFLIQWNFTKPRIVIPYVHIAGGVLFTTSDVPPPNTSSINFTPQIGSGVHWFLRPNRSVDFSVDVVHHSNASLGDHNPGYNASVFFTVGYSWYKPRH